MRPAIEALVRPSISEIPVLPEVLFGKTHALIAPGSGSQHKGMGQDLALRSPAATALWKRADSTLRPLFGADISDVSWNGDEELIRQSLYGQPIKFVDSLARKEALMETGQLGEPGWHAGNSLGLAVALVNVGSLSIEAIAQLEKGRQDAIQYTIEHIAERSKMLALEDIDEEISRQVADRFGLKICLVNSDRQVILGGVESVIQETQAYVQNEVLGKIKGGKVAQVEGVDVAFHSSFMEPGLPLYAEVVNSIHIDPPMHGSVIGGGTVTPLHTTDDIRNELIWQLTHTENWKGVVEFFQKNGVLAITEAAETPTLTFLYQKSFGGNRKRLQYPKSLDTDKTLYFAHRWYAPDIAA